LDRNDSPAVGQRIGEEGMIGGIDQVTVLIVSRGGGRGRESVRLGGLGNSVSGDAILTSHDGTLNLVLLGMEWIFEAGWREEGGVGAGGKWRKRG